MSCYNYLRVNSVVLITSPSSMNVKLELACTWKLCNSVCTKFLLTGRLRLNTLAWLVVCCFCCSFTSTFIRLFLFLKRKCFNEILLHQCYSLSFQKIANICRHAANDWLVLNSFIAWQRIKLPIKLSFLWVICKNLSEVADYDIGAEVFSSLYSFANCGFFAVESNVACWAHLIPSNGKFSIDRCWGIDFRVSSSIQRFAQSPTCT